jgi:aryl-alcohol dehydrogenase-like predicted oxidoreductase
MAQTLGLAATLWGILEGGVLTGKYDASASVSSEPRRYADEQGDAALAAGRLIRSIADELGVSSAQVATAWARRAEGDRGTLIPIIGARTVAQLRDALGVLDVSLPDDVVQRLDEVRRPAAEFPGSFLASDHVHGLIFGDTYDLIDRTPA